MEEVVERYKRLQALVDKVLKEGFESLRKEEIKFIKGGYYGIFFNLS